MNRITGSAAWKQESKKIEDAIEFKKYINFDLWLWDPQVRGKNFSGPCCSCVFSIYKSSVKFGIDLQLHSAPATSFHIFFNTITQTPFQNNLGKKKLIYILGLNMKNPTSWISFSSHL